MPSPSIFQGGPASASGLSAIIGNKRPAQRGRPPTGRAGRRGIGFLPAPAKPHSRPTRWMLRAWAPQTYPRPLNPAQPGMTGCHALGAQSRRDRQRAGSLQHEPLHIGRRAVPHGETPADRAGVDRMQQAAVADRRCGMTRDRPISRVANGAARPCAPGDTSVRGGFPGMSSLTGSRLGPATRTRTPNPALAPAWGGPFPDHGSTIGDSHDSWAGVMPCACSPSGDCCSFSRQRRARSATRQMPDTDGNFGLRNPNIAAFAAKSHDVDQTVGGSKCWALLLTGAGAAPSAA